MRRRKVILLAVAAGLFGLILIGYGLVFDPFSIPFQDYQQMPEEVQLSYEQKSTTMKEIRYIGLAVVLLSLLILIAAVLNKKKNQK